MVPGFSGGGVEGSSSVAFTAVGSDVRALLRVRLSSDDRRGNRIHHTFQTVIPHQRSKPTANVSRYSMAPQNNERP
jgi:hypothetical protein